MFREYDLFTFIVQYFRNKRELLKHVAFERAYIEDNDVYKLMKDQAKAFAYGEFEHLFRIMEKEHEIRKTTEKEEHEKRKDIIRFGGLNK